MTAVHRRTFVQRLALGAGAALLGPLVTRLEGEARGAVSARKRFIVVTVSNGFGSKIVSAPGFEGDKEIKASGYDPGKYFELTDFQLSEALAPLAKHRSRMAVIRGLGNAQQSNTGHTMGFAGLACLPKGSENDPCLGITLDEQIANQISKGNAYGTIHLGVQKPGSLQVQRFFAQGPNRPSTIMLTPHEAFKTYFGGAPTGSSASAALDAAFAKRKKLLDFLKDDVKRVSAALAGPERQKLDEFVASVDGIEQRLAAAASAGKGGTCGASLAPATVASDEERTELQFDLLAAVLICGLTNVATFSQIGLSCRYPGLGQPSEIDMHQIGHGQMGFLWPRIVAFHTKLVARLVDKLSAAKEGDGSVFDNSLLALMNDNGEGHHAMGREWPVVVLGNAGGKFKANGRYIRFPARVWGGHEGKEVLSTPAGYRSAPDLYCTFAHALGAPTDSFGKGGKEPVKGPLSELLA